MITFDLLPVAIEEIIDQLDAIERLLMKKPYLKQPEGYITKKKACELLHISLHTVLKLIKTGELDVYTLVGRDLLLEAQVLRYQKKSIRLQLPELPE